MSEEEIFRNSTNTRVIFKDVENWEGKLKYYFIVNGASFLTVGYTAKIYVEEVTYEKYDINSSPRFMFEKLEYPYMWLGNVVEL
jgi:hypothetical protein